MNNIGLNFVLIIAFIFFGSTAFFIQKIFRTLRTQNVNFIEAIFLSYVYLLNYLFSKCANKDDLEISRKIIWKHFWYNCILLFGIIVIVSFWIIKLKTLNNI